MKKITLLFLSVVTATCGLAQNLISNGTFEDETGWTVINHYEVANTLGSVTFSEGVATFNETAAGDWKHMGIYTSVMLDPGTYQFDMNMTYTDINDCWGEVYIGTTEPVQNEDYSGDQQVIKAYNAWDCPDIKTFNGLATTSGCDTATNPGEFEITTAGTYYLLFRSGGSTYGTTGIVIDNMSLVSTSPAPVAAFTSVTSASNLNAVFTNTSTDAISYSWDFGDGSGTSTDANPTYTYANEGVYTVALTANSGAESSLFTAAITVGNPTNLITNGDFNDDTGWTIINHYEIANTLGSVTITGGVATFDETMAGDWKHMGIYTSVVLDPGTYQFDMDMTYTDINDVWGEAYIGSTEPVQNEDYSGEQQVIKAYNAWDCPEIKTYTGSATASGCDESAIPGQFEISTAGTYYLLFRSGGSTYGTTGIVLDNLSLYRASALSVKDFEIEGLTVYPNPTNHSWGISTKNTVIDTIEVFEILGKRVMLSEPNTISATIDASNLNAGIYITKIITELGTVTKRLIKQ